MFHRFIATVTLVACAGVYALAATERATFILTDGERKSGPVVFHGGSHENLIDGHLNLGVDGGGPELTFPIDQVAVIDFVGGTPETSELAQLGSGQMLVMRDGRTQQGRFINLIGGTTLLWESQAGQRQQFAIRDASRIYLNPQSARIAFHYNGPTRSAANEGGLGPIVTVRVPATQAWIDTGMIVNQGDRVIFEANGRIQYAPGPRQTATPDGNPGERRGENYPIPMGPIGALIGRVGDGPSFAIGMETQPLMMPSSGRLMLGVNDNDLGDNRGFFTVTVTKSTDLSDRERPRGRRRR